MVQPPRLHHSRNKVTGTYTDYGRDTLSGIAENLELRIKSWQQSTVFAGPQRHSCRPNY